MKIFLSDNVQIPYKQFYLLSPDGFTLERDAEPFDDIRQAAKAFEVWKQRYESQGYYSSNKFGRIPLEELKNYMLISEVPFALI